MLSVTAISVAAIIDVVAVGDGVLWSGSQETTIAESRQSPGLIQANDTFSAARNVLVFYHGYQCFTTTLITLFKPQNAPDHLQIDDLKRL
jgi:hypothetical protein